MHRDCRNRAKKDKGKKIDGSWIIFFAHVRVSRYGIQERVNYDSVPSSRPSSSEVESNTIAGCGWVSANTNHDHAGHTLR